MDDVSLEIMVEYDGTIRLVYHEALDLACLGSPTIRRGSEVEPTVNGQWTADLSRVGGPRLGPFVQRSQAIRAEVAWLRRHWLVGDAAAFNLPSDSGELS